MTDVINEVVLGSFWLMLPGLGPNHCFKSVALANRLSPDYYSHGTASGLSCLLLRLFHSTNQHVFNSVILQTLYYKPFSDFVIRI